MGSCRPKTKACPAGKWLKAGSDMHTASDDVVCTPCPTGEFKAGENAATSCAPRATCTAEQWECFVPATAKENRECCNVTQCLATEYETTTPVRFCSTSSELFGPASTSNTSNISNTTSSSSSSNASYVPKRVCKPADRTCGVVTICSVAEYQTQPLDRYKQQNRACAPIKTCADGTEFEISAPTATSNRRCMNIATQCVADEQYEQAAPDATSNRRCAPLSVCNTPSKTHPFEPNASDNATRSEFKDPTTLYYEVQAPSPSSDRVCKQVAPKVPFR